MDFGFTLTGQPADGTVCWDRFTVGALDVQSKERLRLVVDTFGRNSCRSQALPAVITDLYRLQTSDHKLYLAISQTAGRLTVFGGIKTGIKKLFIRVETGAFREIQPVCVLDFYVNEDYQRKGLGKHLFEHFLAAERQTAASIGYDKPSPKLLAFLRKYYGLARYIPQSNNFVVFSAYFQGAGQQTPADSTWNSVSQRPLTAKQRPHMRTADYGQAALSHRQGTLFGSIPARRLSESMPGQHGSLTAESSYDLMRPGHMGALSVPAFRTASGRPAESEQPSGQTSRQGAVHQHQPAAGCSSQASLAVSAVMRQESGDMSRQGNSSALMECSPRSTLLQPMPHGSSWGHGPGPQPETAQEEATMQGQTVRAGPSGYRGSRGATQDYSRRGHADSASTSGIMHVKPPWATDDPYQAGSVMQHRQHKQAAAAASMIYSPWSSQVAAGKQQSGAGIRECLRW